MTAYQKRDSHFAHKTFRLMHKASVAAEIGRDAFCLVAVVLHTEDAARYRGPVRFFNSQLMETLGFAKWESFNRARQRAIESGWLSYEGDGKRSAGRYFVTIPDGYGEIEDTLIEESSPGLYPGNGYKEGYNDGYKAGYDAGVKADTMRGQCGIQTGDKQGEPPTLYPNPNPNPKKNSKKKECERPEGVPLQTWQDWKASRKGKPITATVLKLIQNEADKAEIDLATAIEFCAGRGWMSFKAEWYEKENPPKKESRVATAEDMKNYNPYGKYE